MITQDEIKVQAPKISKGLKIQNWLGTRKLGRIALHLVAVPYAMAKGCDPHLWDHFCGICRELS